MKYVRTTEVESWAEEFQGDIDDPRDALFFNPDTLEDFEAEPERSASRHAR